MTKSLSTFWELVRWFVLLPVFFLISWASLLYLEENAVFIYLMLGFVAYACVSKDLKTSKGQVFTLVLMFVSLAAVLLVFGLDLDWSTLQWLIFWGIVFVLMIVYAFGWLIAWVMHRLYNLVKSKKSPP